MKRSEAKLSAEEIYAAIAQMRGPFTSRMVGEKLALAERGMRLDSRVRYGLEYLRRDGRLKALRPGSPRESAVWMRADDDSPVESTEVMRLAGSKFRELGMRSLHDCVLDALLVIARAEPADGFAGMATTVRIARELPDRGYGRAVLTEHVRAMLAALAANGAVLQLLAGNGRRPSVWGIPSIARSGDPMRLSKLESASPARDALGEEAHVPRRPRCSQEKSYEAFLREHRRRRLERADGFNGARLPGASCAASPTRSRFSGAGLPINPQFIPCGERAAVTAEE